MPTPMGKLVTLCVAFCAAAALFTTALLYSPPPVSAASGTTESVTLPTPVQKQPAERPAPEAEAPTIYQLRSMDGELCVFRGRTLLHRTGVDVRTLPREDRELLERGISAASQEALASLLEDLSS